MSQSIKESDNIPENKSFEQLKKDSVDNLLKMREWTTLMEIRKEIEERNLCLNCFGNEYDYCESLGAKKAFEEMLKVVDNKINNLKSS